MDEAIRTVDSLAHAPKAQDLACGTGDITPRMVEIGSRKPPPDAGRCAFGVGDMMALPFPDDDFDFVTVGYGLRFFAA